MTSSDPRWSDPRRSDRGLPPGLDPRGPGQSRRARSAAQRVGSHAATPRQASAARAPAGAPARAEGATPPAGTGGRTAGARSSAAGGGRPPVGDGGGRGGAVAAWLATALSVAVLLSSGIGYALFDHYSGRIDRIDVGQALGGDRSLGRSLAGSLGASGPTTFLVVGSDSRDGALNEEFQGEGDAETAGQRSDTLILVRVNADGDVATAVSMPRDSYVTIPGYGEGSSRVPKHKEKINAALEDGGPSLLIRTVEELSGLNIDHYVQMDFAGFLNVVDALGGVEVCLTEPAREKDSGIDLPAGRQTISGAQALAFVRQRQGLPGGDLGRIERQQQFLGSVVREVTTFSTLTNPARLNNFLRAVTSSVSVDDDVNFRSLALRLSGIDPADVRFQTVPVEGIDTVQGVGSVVLLDDDGVRDLFLDIDEPPAPAPEALAVQPADVEVEVLNGAGVGGLAGRVSGELEDVGFTIAAEPSDADVSLSRTQIRYAPDDEDAAETLLAALPGARLEEDPDLRGEPLQVIVGEDDQEVQAVPGAAGPSAAPSETPELGDTITAADNVCTE